MRPPFSRRCTAAVLATALLSALPAMPAALAAPDIVAAGDIACAGVPCRAQRGTARLIGRIDPRAVLTLGDNQYQYGALADFRSSYDPTWGRFRGRTRPTPGNHEYGTSGAGGYFTYFGKRARPWRDGTYSFDLGRWHLVAINSGRGYITRAQLRWVQRDLRRDDHRCELAYWHHPRYSSGRAHGSDQGVQGLWRVLFRAGTDVVLNGHEHNYERFALMSPRGQLAPHRGIREFVVGTGGAYLYQLGEPIHGSQRRIDDRYGVLRLILHSARYEWRFKTLNGAALDRGAHLCHA